VPYATAYRALFIRGGAKPGEVVLVHGASGGVGVAATQIGVAAGLRMLGTAGTPAGRELVQQQGASAVFDHTAEGYVAEIMAATKGRGVDVILEMCADKNLEADMSLLSKGGRIMVIGNRGRIEINPRGVMSVEADIRGVALAHTSSEERKIIDAALNAGFRGGVLTPIADATEPLPLERAAQAHADILSLHRLGKLILEPWGPGSSL
jgi:NADPH2:quinone reductase